MKILLINHFPLQGTGSGTYTLNIAKELIKKQHQVIVIEINNQFDKKKYPFKLETIMATIDFPFNFPVFTNHPKSFLTFYNLTAEQIEQYIQALRKKIESVINDFHPDLIHAQHVWIIPYILYTLGVPYIITSHGTDLIGFQKDRRYHKIALEGAYYASKIITISKQVYNDVINFYHVSEAKVTRIPNGFDDNIFHILDVDKEKVLRLFDIHKENKQTVSFVGKLCYLKGVDIFLDAILKIIKELPETIFIIVGNGELGNELCQQAINLGIKEFVFLFGFQEQENLAQIYNISDILVVPSRTEPFGLVALEALACGTPVIGTNVGGLSDFINEEVGRVLPIENSELLASVIIEELKNNSKQKKGKKAGEHAKSNFKWSKIIDQVIKLYYSCK